MGLLDRVKQNQTVPPAGPTGNGPAATATLPGAATTYPSASAAPAAQTAAPAAPAAGLQRGPVGGDLSPAFAAAKVQNAVTRVELHHLRQDPRGRIQFVPGEDPRPGANRARSTGSQGASVSGAR